MQFVILMDQQELEILEGIQKTLKEILIFIKGISLAVFIVGSTWIINTFIFPYSP